MIPAPPPAREWPAYLRAHGRSFSFAARLLPAAERQRIAAVYAFCRYTDDLVDRAELPSDEARVAELDEWLAAARAAYAGASTGIELVDEVIGAMGRAQIPFGYVEELVAGMGMDLRRERYETLDDLAVYTQRVAGVVGLWLTELSGVHDPHVLAHAAQLGRAMQLTNILRDVGEDLAAGRVYLPAALLAERSLTIENLEELARANAGRPSARGATSAAYEDLLETLIDVAERDYRDAFAAIPLLPEYFQRTVAVAAAVYRGIHDELRRLGARSLHVRARTSASRKVLLAAAALRRLRALRERRRDRAWTRASVPNGNRHWQHAGSVAAGTGAPLFSPRPRT